MIYAKTSFAPLLKGGTQDIQGVSPRLKLDNKNIKFSIKDITDENIKPIIDENGHNKNKCDAHQHIAMYPY